MPAGRHVEEKGMAQENSKGRFHIRFIMLQLQPEQAQWPCYDLTRVTAVPVS